MTIAYISHSNCDKLDSVVKCQPEIATQMMESVCFFSIMQVGALGNGKSAYWGGGKAWAEVMILMNITCTDFPIARAGILLNSSLDSSDKDIFPSKTRLYLSVHKVDGDRRQNIW